VEVSGALNASRSTFSDNTTFYGLSSGIEDGRIRVEVKKNWQYKDVRYYSWGNAEESGTNCLPIVNFSMYSNGDGGWATFNISWDTEPGGGYSVYFGALLVNEDPSYPWRSGIEETEVNFQDGQASITIYRNHTSSGDIKAKIFVSTK